MLKQLLQSLPKSPRLKSAPENRKRHPSFEDLESRLVPAVYTVNSFDDDSLSTVAPCEVTLRSAIELVNLSADLTNEIDFQIPGTGTFSPYTSLPEIHNQVVINGFSQSGTPGVYGIVLDGTHVSDTSIYGLHISADNCEVSGLVISNFADAGIFIDAADCTTIVANRIGTNIDGDETAGNGNGIIISNGSHNQIGTSTSGEGNLISGNSDAGVLIEGVDSELNFVQGNYIGTDVSGELELANDVGVRIVGSSYNLIGGEPGTSDLGEGNLISGNTCDGIRIEGGGEVDEIDDEWITTVSPASFNRISGNRIGTTVDGDDELGNGANGVRITDGAYGTVIGYGILVDEINITINSSSIVPAEKDPLGPSPSEAGGWGNLISGNGASGVLIDGAGVTTHFTSDLQPVRGSITYGTFLGGNLIGLNADGDGAVANHVGVTVENGAKYVSIGNFGNGIEISNLYRNVISGNTYQGIKVHGIGQGNGAEEIGLDRTSPVIGYFGAGTGAVRIAGNLIGTDITGESAVGNQHEGILVDNATSLVIIGIPGAALPSETDLDEEMEPKPPFDPTSRLLNVISGNGGNGVTVEGLAVTLPSDNDTERSRIFEEDSSRLVAVGGNFIGITLSGAELGNAGNGIEMSGLVRDCTIGADHYLGPVQGGNIIAGNTLNGVFIHDTNYGLKSKGAAEYLNNVIDGNLIGLTDSAYLGGLPLLVIANGEDGIRIENSRTISVGSIVPLYANVISGNRGNGISVLGSSEIHIYMNYVGIDLTGQKLVDDNDVDLGNEGDGILIANGSTGVLVGEFVTPTSIRDALFSPPEYFTGDSATLVPMENSMTTWSMLALFQGGTGSVIANNNGAGIRITGSGTECNKVFGQYIGTNMNLLDPNAVDAMTFGRGNDEGGIVIEDHASDNTIGESITITQGVVATDLYESGGKLYDFLDSLPDAEFRKQVAEMAFGTDENTDFTRGKISTLSSPVIYGGNIIVGNGTNANHAAGILIRGADASTESDATIIQNNLIGITPNASAGNAGAGIEVTDQTVGETVTGTTYVMIGGLSNANRNVISANAGDGISVHGSHVSLVQISSNYIGTGIDGLSDEGNGESGVSIADDAYNIIVGVYFDSDDIGGNTIGWNESSGVHVENVAGSEMDGKLTVISGNFIGVTENGDTISNVGDGISVENSSVVLVGGDSGTHSSVRNHISKNGQNGVHISGAATDLVIVSGNLIGEETGASEGDGNEGDGILIDDDATGVLIGTYILTPDSGSPFCGNAIGFNSGHGVHVNGVDGDAESGNIVVIASNEIYANGSISSAKDGIFIEESDNVIIGGLTSDVGNSIYGNTGNGIEVTSASAILADVSVRYNEVFENNLNGVLVDKVLGVKVELNSMWDNGLLGIDLINSGNSNQSQPFVNGSISYSHPTLIIPIEVVVPTSSSVRVQFFKADSSGTEGLEYLEEYTYSGTGPQDVYFDIDTLGLVNADYIVAVAIAENGDTSEFAVIADLSLYL